MKKEKTSKLNKKTKIIISVILFIFLVCAISYLVYNFYNSNKNKSLYDDLQQDIIPDETTNELAQ